MLIVGITGAGKSTVANAIVGSDDRFTVSGQLDSVTADCSHCDVELNDDTGSYRVKVMDTAGFFDTGPTTNAQAIAKLKDYVNSYFPEGMSLIIFVLREGRLNPVEKNTLDFIQKHFRAEISEISALVFTNCDMKNDEIRGQIVEDFKTNPRTKAVAEFMKVGIYTVGFPPKSTYTNLPAVVKEYYEEGIRKDKGMLWDVIKRCSTSKLHQQLYDKSFWDRCTIL